MNTSIKSCYNVGYRENDEDRRRKVIIHSAEEMKAFAKRVASLASGGEVLDLQGDLGAGKTTFTQGFMEAFAYEGAVTSPTFAIVNQYDASKMRVYHLDLYRIENPEEIEELDYETYLYPNQAISILEWSSQIEEYLPKNREILKIRNIDANTRELIWEDDSIFARAAEEDKNACTSC